MEIKKYKIEVKSTSDNFAFEITKNGTIKIDSLNLSCSKNLARKLIQVIESFSEIDDCCTGLTNIELTKITI